MKLAEEIGRSFVTILTTVELRKRIEVRKPKILKESYKFVVLTWELFSRTSNVFHFNLLVHRIVSMYFETTHSNSEDWLKILQGWSADYHTLYMIYFTHTTATKNQIVDQYMSTFLSILYYMRYNSRNCSDMIAWLKNLNSFQHTSNLYFNFGLKKNLFLGGKLK